MLIVPRQPVQSRSVPWTLRSVRVFMPSPAHHPGVSQAGNACRSGRPSLSPVGAQWDDSPSCEPSGFPCCLSPGCLEKQHVRCVRCSGLTDQLITGFGSSCHFDSSSPVSASLVASRPAWPHHPCPSAPVSAVCKKTTFLAAERRVLMAF